MTECRIHEKLRPLYAQLFEAVEAAEEAVRLASRLSLHGTHHECVRAVSHLTGAMNEIELLAEPEFAPFRAALGHGENVPTVKED